MDTYGVDKGAAKVLMNAAAENPPDLESQLLSCRSHIIQNNLAIVICVHRTKPVIEREAIVAQSRRQLRSGFLYPCTVRRLGRIFRHRNRGPVCRLLPLGFAATWRSHIAPALPSPS